MEPFPAVEEENKSPSSPRPPTTPVTPTTRANRAPRPSNASSNTTRRLRGASLKFLESNPPSGMWMATGDIISQAPTLNEIRTGCFSADGWTEEGQMERRGSTAHDIHRRKLTRSNTLAARVAAASTPAPPALDALHEQNDQIRRSFTDPSYRVVEKAESRDDTMRLAPEEVKAAGVSPQRLGTFDGSAPVQGATPAPVPDETGTYPNGYRFPPKHTWKQATIIGLKAFGRFIITPFGFLVTLYGLNIVAWGAMIFFLLLNAAPAMCHPSCSASNSPRQIWIEIDSQILNALFCVTGFGLIPWRFRDVYYLLQWRLMSSHDGLRKLAGIHRTWFRLPNSDKLADDIGPPPVYSSNTPHEEISLTYTDEELEQLRNNPALPFPPSSIPPAPLTGARAPPTKPWLLDMLVWMYVLNTVLQACLAGIMWGLNRFTRPSWAVGFLIAAGCVTGMIAGWITFQEGRRVKNIEGVPVVEEPKADALEEATEDPAERQKLKKRRTQSFKRKSKWYRRI
ncbi:hypothetical protein FQN52_006510 [Onygenales sp. PD_12]|nr:hypothetical protein FQN53_004168 [Emmonsiellopsis sp. PD_33]KAK2788754.1 hypothetical protein FQN52_006510 [Onygenales sp. PD_12]